MPVLELTWRDVPPSLNRKGRSAPIAQHRLKTELQATLEGLLMASGLPRNLDRVEAWAVMTFPKLIKRDEGNFRWLLEKALGDALQNGRWLPNDDADHFRFYLVKFDPERGAKQTIISLRYGEAAPLVEV